MIWEMQMFVLSRHLIDASCLYMKEGGREIEKVIRKGKPRWLGGG